MDNNPPEYRWFPWNQAIWTDDPLDFRQQNLQPIRIFDINSNIKVGKNKILIVIKSKSYFQNVNCLLSIIRNLHKAQNNSLIMVNNIDCYGAGEAQSST